MINTKYLDLQINGVLNVNTIENRTNFALDSKLYPIKTAYN